MILFVELEQLNPTHIIVNAYSCKSCQIGKILWNTRCFIYARLKLTQTFLIYFLIEHLNVWELRHPNFKMKQPKFWQPVYRMAPRKPTNHPLTQTPPHLDPTPPPSGPLLPTIPHHPLDPYHTLDATTPWTTTI